MVVNRRVMLGGLAAWPALSGVSAALVRPARDPRTSAIGLVRLQASLEPRVVTPWWYEVAIYAVMPARPPLLILRAEGCETYMIRAEPDGRFRSRGVTVTAFKDPVDDTWIDQFENPVTHQRNLVNPNILTGGAFIYPADGSVPLPDATTLKPAQSAPGARGAASTTGWVKWIESGPMVGCMMERKSTGAYQPYMETTSMWTDAAAFFDLAVPVRQVTFSSSFLVPWLGWMEMSGVPGHLLWHSTGRKLGSLDELPARYRARAEVLAPGVLANDPFAA